LNNQSLEVRRRLPAPVTEVFRWCTEPERLSQWMTPVGTVDAEVDLRIGGALRIVMRGEGQVIEHTGEFLEIEKPRRLVFTWVSPFTGLRPSRVTVELEPDGQDGTLLRLIHSDLTETEADSHQQGWTALIDRLQQRIGAEADLSHAR
jgi:uncharacterized protein YndB with AHSA1/START domain